MVENIITKLFSAAKSMISYKPPTDPDPFVLDEDRPFDGLGRAKPAPSDQELTHASLENLLRFADRLESFGAKLGDSLGKGNWLAKAGNWKLELEALEQQFQQLTPVLLRYDESRKDPSSRQLSTSLGENRKMLEAIYKVPPNKDVVFRDISIAAHPPVKALAVFLDGMVDSGILNLSVLKPLMLYDGPRELYGKDLVDKITGKCLPSNQIARAYTFHELEDGINSGDTALLFDGCEEGLLVNTKGWQHRGVERPLTEQTVRGAQAAFSENLRVNTGLIRTMLRSSDLVTEMVKVGDRSKVNCAIMYLESVANASLVDEVRRRVKGIKTDYVGESGELLQFIEDHPTIPFPQSLSTERPDRVASNLAEGRIALILEGNPFVHIVPVSFYTFFHSAEDFGVKSGVGNFMRVTRLFGALIATVLPALYLALSYFHQEAVPTELLLTIAGSRESVPFPAWFEVMVMEVSFELIREAGVRIPGFLGSTIGIVGAIILGQAAVSAHLVSPIVVVIIAITGLASFTIPEYRMSSALRITRFILFLFATFLGLVGLATALLWITLMFCWMKSFGMPYMAPIAPKANAGYDVVLRGPVYKQETRPDELNPRDKIRQPYISRQWSKKPPKEEGGQGDEI